MTFIPVTILSRDETDGKTIYVRADNIVSFAQVDIRKDDVHLIGVSKVTQGSLIWFSNGKPQTVSELPEQLLELLNGPQVLNEKYSGL
jgi:hypothetical protein